METITITVVQTLLFALIAASAMIFVKFEFKKHALEGTRMILDRQPSLTELPLSSGVPALVVGTVMVMVVGAWIFVPVMIVGVILWSVVQERARYDLKGKKAR